jgi:hypothetical protein
MVTSDQRQIFLFKRIIIRLAILRNIYDHLCGLVVRVPDYRSRGPGSIPGPTRFSEK